MHTLSQADPKRNRPTTLHDWQAREAAQALREDHQRPAVIPSHPTVAFYARYGAQEGYAARTPDLHCFFVSQGQVTELTNADIPTLTLLGRVDVVEQQQVLDTLQRGYAAMATSRRQEV